jgi:hypothetical protein
MDELPVCIHCGTQIMDHVPRVWEEVSPGLNIPAHMYVNACVAGLRRRIEELEGGKSSVPLARR